MASISPCACKDLGLPVEECVCSKVGVGAPPPPSGSLGSQGPPQEVSAYESGSSSIAPTEHRTSVYDTEFSEIMNDQERDLESSLGDPSLHPDSYTETVGRQRTHDSLDENSASGADSEEDGSEGTLAEERSNCSIHSGLTAELENCLAADLEAAAAALEEASEASVPQSTPPQSLANLRRDSPAPTAKKRETSELTAEEDYEEPGSEHHSESHLNPDSGKITEGSGSKDERPRKQRKLT